MWIRKEPNFELWKITKDEAFFQMYLEMMKQALPVYFISPAGMEHLQDEPLHKAY